MRSNRRNFLGKLFAQPTKYGPATRARGPVSDSTRTGNGPSTRGHGPGANASGFGVSAMSGIQSLSLPAPKTDLDLLFNRASLGFNPTELAQAKALGFDGWLEQQLGMASLVESSLEAEIAAKYPRVNASLKDLLNDARVNDAAGNPGGGGLYASHEHEKATILRRLKTTKHLYEIMVEFWSDHFNICNNSNPMSYFKIAEDREVIRAHALGNFGDMLKASAPSLAMLAYLENDSNEKLHANENYAREMMELHTLGEQSVSNAYTEDDVKAVARALTGWTYTGTQPDVGDPVFLYDSKQHDDGQKVILREVFAAGGGKSDGDRVLAKMAKHPATHHHIATKLCTFFIQENPPARVVDEVAATMATTHGDIPSMLRTLFNSQEFLDSADKKTYRPCAFIVKALRVAGAVFTTSTGVPLQSVSNIPFTVIDSYMTQLISWLDTFGAIPFDWSPPNGKPDSISYWTTTGSSLSYMNFACELAENKINSNISVDSKALVGTSNTPTKIVDAMVARILPGRSLSNADRTSLINFVANGGSTTAVIPDTEPGSRVSLDLRIQECLAILLGSAYFLYR